MKICRKTPQNYKKNFKKIAQTFQNLIIKKTDNFQSGSF